MVTELKLKASDLSRTASSSDVIYDALRDAIIRGEIAEGESLRQDSIAHMFGVSRIPVREALKRLEAQGLAVSQRYKGVVVAALSPTQITEIFEFRALIEPTLIALAVPRMTEDSLNFARGSCAAFAGETDPARWGDLNRQFHISLYRDADRPYFFSVLAKTNDMVERYVRLVLSIVQDMRAAVAEHQAILDACVARDASHAAELTRLHITNAGAILAAYLRDHRNDA